MRLLDKENLRLDMTKLDRAGIADEIRKGNSSALWHGAGDGTTGSERQTHSIRPLRA